MRLGKRSIAWDFADVKFEPYLPRTQRASRCDYYRLAGLGDRDSFTSNRK